MSSKDVDCPIATANTPKAPGMITTTHWLRTPENHIYYCSLSCRCPIFRQYTLSSCCAWWRNSWNKFTCQASRRGTKVLCTWWTYNSGVPWINQFEICKILVKCSYKYAIYAKAPPFWAIFRSKIWADAVGCGRIGPHRSALRHASGRITIRRNSFNWLGRCGRIPVDLLGFECYGKLCQLNNAVRCGKIRQEAGGKIL